MTSTIALPRTDWLARLRTIMVLRPGQRVVQVPGAGVSVSRRAVSAPGSGNWWEAGSAPTPVAVYQPKGAASLAASYVNLANPGTYNAAPGVAPTFDAATGWTFNGSTQYLTTGITPGSATWSALCRFSGGTTTGYKIVFGTRYTGATSQLFEIFQQGDGVSYYANGGFVSTARVVAGVLSLAGKSAYKNGVADGTISAGELSAIGDIYIGGTHASTGAMFYFTGNVQAVAVWNTSTNHATWMPAVSAAVALI